MSLAKRAGAALGVAILLVAAVPALTGRPVASFPVSGSMEPTIGVFDVFFVLPFAHGIERGDIIVFDSVTQGRLAVHRVIGGDDTGWFTQGDANAEADQVIGEPVIGKDRVLGRVLTWPGGAPVLLPGLGLTLTELAAQKQLLEQRAGGQAVVHGLVLAMLAAALAGPSLFGPRRRAPRLGPRATRALRRIFPRGVLGAHVGIALLALLVVSGAWAANRGHTTLDVTVVVVRDPTAADGLNAGAPGDLMKRDLRVGSLGYLPTVVVLDGSDRVHASDRALWLASWSGGEMTVEQRADLKVGLQTDTVDVWRYPAFLPERAMLTLHDAAPGAPYVVLIGGFVVVGAVWLHAMGVMRRPVGRWVGLQEDWL